MRTSITFKSLHILLVGLALNACKPATHTEAITPTINTAPQAATMTELSWARAALERNPHLKVLAVDETQHRIQVQVKATGETLLLSPGELAGVPISDFLSQAPTTSTSTSPSTSSNTASTTEAAVSSEVATATMAETSSSSSAQAKYDYQVERSQNRVRVTGPGISIESSGVPTKSANDKVAATDLPIVCAGQQLMHLNNKNLNVEGDAIIARDGCELHITNSYIAATGTAVAVQDAAVHIDNSEIKGTRNSLTTAAAARLYIRHSAFSGLVRRDPQAVIQDQGDNTWR